MIRNTNNIILAIYGLLLVGFVQCTTADYDEPFNTLNDQLNVLSNQDKKIKLDLDTEINQLRAQLQDKITTAEQLIAQRLNNKQKAISTELEQQANKLRERTNQEAMQLQINIDNWKTQLDKIAVQGEGNFEIARKKMVDALEKSIHDGDLALQQQLQKQLTKLSKVESTFGAIIENKQKRMQALEDYEKRISQINEKIKPIEEIYKRIEQKTMQSNQLTKQLIDSSIADYTSTELAEIVAELVPIMNQAQSVVDAALSVVSEIESIEIPDFESLIADLPDYGSMVDDMRKVIDDFGSLDISSMEAQLDELLESVNGEDPEEALDTLDQLIEEVNEAVNNSKDKLDELVSTFEEGSQELEDFLDELIDEANDLAEQLRDKIKD